MQSRTRRITFAVGGLFVALGVAWLVSQEARKHFSPADLRADVRQFGALAPLAYLAAFAVAPLLLFPASLLTAASGLLWGWPEALAFALLGLNLNGNLAFGLARAVGQDRIQRLSHGWLKRYDKKLEGSGASGIAGLRLLPVMPYSLLGYVAGVSQMRWRDYALGNAVGTLLPTIIWVLALHFIFR